MLLLYAYAFYVCYTTRYMYGQRLCIRCEQRVTKSCHALLVIKVIESSDSVSRQ